MKKQMPTAVALILALGFAPLMAQDTSPSNETTTEAGTEAEAPTPPTGGETTAEGEVVTEGETTTETPTSGETTTETGEEAGVEVVVTPEQETEIEEVIVQENVDKIEVDFDVNLGVAIPPTITLHPVPVRIVELVPAYDGFMYFLLADGRIVIVDPDTMKIVLILAA